MKNFFVNLLWVILIGSVLLLPMIIAWVSGFDFVRGPDLAGLVIGTVVWAGAILVVANA